MPDDLIRDTAKRIRPKRQCEECGSDRWVARDAQMRFAAAQRMNDAAQKIARENGELRLRVAVLEAERNEIQGLLQRKITRQARVIRRMEERLRELGRKPYEDAPLGESAAAAEYDAGQLIESPSRGRSET